MRSPRAALVCVLATLAACAGPASRPASPVAAAPAAPVQASAKAAAPAAAAVPAPRYPLTPARSKLADELNRLAAVLARDPALGARLMGASGTSQTARKYASAWFALLGDPAFSRDFVQGMSDEEVAGFGQGDSRQLGYLIGRRLMHDRTRTASDALKVRMLSAFRPLFANATPVECDAIMSDAKAPLYFTMLDRLPAAAQDEFVAVLMATARDDGAVSPPLGADDRLLVQIAVRQFVVEQSPAEQERLRKAFAEPGSPDRCWGVARIIDALDAGGPELRRLGAKMVFEKGFGT